MSYRVEEIEGIGPAPAARLHRADVRTTDDLVELLHDAEAAATVASLTGMSRASLRRLAKAADLMRITGVGPQAADLLVAAGVDGVQDLKRRNPQRLAKSLAAAKAAKRLARTSPSADGVAQWVKHAKGLKRPRTHRARVLDLFSETYERL